MTVRGMQVLVHPKAGIYETPDATCLKYPPECLSKPHFPHLQNGLTGCIRWTPVAERPLCGRTRGGPEGNGVHPQAGWENSRW